MNIRGLGISALCALTVLSASCSTTSHDRSNPPIHAKSTSTIPSGQSDLSVPASLPDGSFPSVEDPRTDGSLRAIRVTMPIVATATEPTALVPRPNHPTQLFLSQRAGQILLVTINATTRKLTVHPKALADLTSLTSTDGENGLLGLAFSPQGDTLYISYTLHNGDSRIDEAPVTDLRGHPHIGTRTTLIRVNQHGQDIHKGGDLAVDSNGLLYIGFGDGGPEDDPENHAQNLSLLQGKILRIDPGHPANGKPYRIPPTNPYRDSKVARPEIVASGLRNPWRFSIDATTGDLWIGDVGQDKYEEIDRLPHDVISAGLNFGWSGLEGTHIFVRNRIPAFSVPPIYEMSHVDGYCAVTGGFVYRGKKIPALDGAYLFSDLCHAGVNVLRTTTPKNGIGSVLDVRTLTGTQEAKQVISFAQDAQGELYTLSLGGRIRRLDLVS